MKKKYNIGDKVYIKSIEWYNKHKNDKGYISSKLINHGFAKKMSKYCGKLATIISVDTKHNNYFIYYLDIDEEEWCWTEKMFESVKKIRKRKLKKLNT